MLPTIEIVQVGEPSVEGVAITLPDRTDPILLVPFPRNTLRGGFALNSHEILFIAIGSGPHHLELAKFDAEIHKFVQEASYDILGNDFRLSDDRQRLYVTGGYPKVSCIDLSTLQLAQAPFEPLPPNSTPERIVYGTRIKPPLPPLHRSHRDAIVAFVHEKAIITIVVKDWSANSVAAALREQAVRLDTRFSSMVMGPDHTTYLRFRYVVGGENLEEAAFFQRLVDDKIDAAEALRHLLTIYLRKIPKSNLDPPWLDGLNAIPALGPAMRALLLLDHKAVDVFRTFFNRATDKHRFCQHVIVPDVAKLYGWRDLHSLRLGLFCALKDRWSNHYFEAEFKGILKAASELVTADACVQMLLVEVNAIEMEPHEREETELFFLSEFWKQLQRADPFQADVARILIERRPALKESPLWCK